MRLVAPLFALAVCASAFAQDKVIVPVYKPKAGEESAWKVEIKFSAMNQDALFTGTAHSKGVKVNDDGSFETENWMQDGKVSIMGSEQEQPGEKHTVKYDPEGNPVENRDLNSGMEEMLSVFSDVTTPKEGAKVGDKWALKDKFDRIGKGEADFLGEADYNGQKCYAFHAAYSPKSGGSSDGKIYLGKDGRLVGFEMTFKEVSIAPGIQSDGSASMKLVTN